MNRALTAGRFALGWTIALIIAAPAMAQAPQCTADRAVWEMAGDGDDVYRITMAPAGRPINVASDVYMKLETTQRAYWFEFAVSMGYSGISLSPVTDPYDPAAADSGPRAIGGDFDETLSSTLRFYALDVDLNFVDPPASDYPAPTYILVPELGRGLWYDLPAFTENADTDRDPMPRGVFRLTRCQDHPHPRIGG